MALLSPTEQDKLREAFAEMTRRVRLLVLTQTFDSETCVMARQILDELPPLSDKIVVDEINLVLDQDKAKAYGIDRAPAVVIVSEEDQDERAERVRGAGASGAINDSR